MTSSIKGIIIMISLFALSAQVLTLDVFICLLHWLRTIVSTKTPLSQCLTHRPRNKTLIDPFSTGAVFIRQNLASADVRF